MKKINCHPHESGNRKILHQVRDDKLKAFTLIEVMIALLVFAVLSVIVSVGLHSVLNTYQHIKAKSARFAELEVALTVMQRDINQIMPRPVLDENDIQQAAVVGKVLSLDLTRGGYVNPDATENRSNLLRVMYSFKNNELIRTIPSDLDENRNTQFASRVLLPNVTSLKFDYIDSHNAQRTFWPLIASDLTSLPRAIEVTLTAKGLGTVQRTFIITGGLPFAKPT